MRVRWRSDDPVPQTDLALEASEFLRARAAQEIPGLTVQEQSRNGITVTRVAVETAAAATLSGKPPGRYVTIEAPGLTDNDRALHQETSEAVAAEVGRLVACDPKAAILVTGLGNWQVTPDSLGPRVVGQLLVTRHLQEYAPPELMGGLRAVCAVAPGVLGLTGIETGEILRGVVERVRPKMVLAVDSLAARNVGRIMTTVQIADTGIHPGSGVGNRRLGITEETLGVPVVAIGVPTVVHAGVIAGDLLEELVGQLERDPRFRDSLGPIAESVRGWLSESASGGRMRELVVTPKQIDGMIRQVARVVAGGLNLALHPGIDADDLARYLNL
ncbi:MAG TPA: GPR endopeptidase [Bacillota bacterium]|nr:GPR endopeptidase [Bacillota bacterium]